MYSCSRALRHALWIVLAAVTFGLPRNLPEADAEPTQPAWPANVRLIHARLDTDDFVYVRLVLPEFRLYDSRGWRLDRSFGYERAEFRRRLESFLAGEGTPDGRHHLNDALPRFQTTGGRRLKQVPPADFTAVEYWADWCPPCIIQRDALAEVLADHPNLSVNLVTVRLPRPGH